MIVHGVESAGVASSGLRNIAGDRAPTHGVAVVVLNRNAYKYALGGGRDNVGWQRHILSLILRIRVLFG